MMERKKSFFILLNFIFSLIFCLKAYGEVLTEQKIKNFTYHLAFGERLVKLKDGKYEAGSKPEDFIRVYIDKFSIKDLDGDGVNDAVVILVGNYGGSGGFYELTALISKDDKLVQTNLLCLKVRG
ncbi:MAG: hypothetical protein ABDH19_04615 [Thermodesulfovibrio sp.]